MSRRYELSDEQWTLVQPLLPQPRRGRPRADDRTMLNGIFWKLCSGAPWRDLPARYGPWQTVYERFRRYRDSHVFDRILHTLHLKLAQDGHLDLSTWMIDGTSVRASRVAAGTKKGGARLRNRKRHRR